MKLHSKVLIYEHNLHFSLVKEGETNIAESITQSF